MYLDYVRDRLGKDGVEMEEGFAIWQFIGDAIYLEDIYVKPEFRKNHCATMIADYVAQVGRTEKKVYMLGTVLPTATGATESLKVLLAYGMRLLKIEDGLIWFYKEL